MNGKYEFGSKIYAYANQLKCKQQLIGGTIYGYCDGVSLVCKPEDSESAIIWQYKYKRLAKKFGW